MTRERTPLKRASYREAVVWIAMNDEPSDTDEASVAGLISTCLVADLFGCEPARVARDIVRVRKAEARAEARATRTRERFELLGFSMRDGRVSCDQCQALAINGVPTHESSCPNAKHECNGCNALIPMRQRYCEDCAP